MQRSRSNIKKYKILFATRVDVFAKTAQSIQVAAMAEAYLALEGAQSIVYCGNKRENTWLNTYKPMKNKILNIAKFNFFIAILLLLNFRVRVVTRDFPVALISCLMLRKCHLEVHQRYKNTFFRLTLRFLIHLGLLRIVAISEGLKCKIQSDLRVPVEKIFVAHDASFSLSEMECRMSELSAETESAFLGSNKKIIHTGSLYKGGQSEILQLCKIIQNLPCTLIHVGGSKKECENLIFLSRKYKNIFFIPARDINEVYRIQRNADIFFYINPKASPYYEFTSPLKLFEYLAWKKPILATRGGAPSEVITDATAYLYTEGDCQGLEKELKAILSDLGPGGSTRHMDDMQIAENHWLSRCERILRDIE